MRDLLESLDRIEEDGGDDKAKLLKVVKYWLEQAEETPDLAASNEYMNKAEKYLKQAIRASEQDDIDDFRKSIQTSNGKYGLT